MEKELKIKLLTLTALFIFFTAGFYITGFLTSTSTGYEATIEPTPLGQNGVINSTSYEAVLSAEVFGGESNSTGYIATFGILPGAFIATTTTTLSGSSPGGGGGPSSGGTPSICSVKGSKIGEVTVFRDQNITIEKFENSSLSSLSFVVNKSVSGCELDVRGSTSEALPATAVWPNEKVFSFIVIEKTNIPDDVIVRAKIRFFVTKTWLSENNVPDGRIILERYENDAWRKLLTTKISTDEKNVYYESDSPGFSIFAIAVLPEGEAPPTSTTIATTTTTLWTPLLDIKKIAETKSEYLGILLIAIFVLIAVIFLRRANQKINRGK